MMDPHHTANRVRDRQRRSQSQRVLQGGGADGAKHRAHLGSKQPSCVDLASGDQDIGIDDLCLGGMASSAMPGFGRL
ncbi:hypothetical protein C1H46_002772 [Malus baccata]|uniref:Uncharacterized protein n=1 Tax=Malus baccata TaxID=106549 RepID=A0A540NM30_MALBA|nr:hypothetical protein C1H46_002772 [Malus baccata]